MSNAKPSQHESRIPLDAESLTSHLTEDEYGTLKETSPEKIVRAVGRLRVAEYRDFDARLALEITRLNKVKEALIAVRTAARQAVMGR